MYICICTYMCFDMHQWCPWKARFQHPLPGLDSRTVAQRNPGLKAELLWRSPRSSHRATPSHHPFQLLVGGLVAIFYFPIWLGNLIIPIDELIFFRGVAFKPPTRWDCPFLATLLGYPWVAAFMDTPHLRVDHENPWGRQGDQQRPLSHWELALWGSMKPTGNDALLWWNPLFWKTMF